MNNLFEETFQHKNVILLFNIIDFRSLNYTNKFKNSRVNDFKCKHTCYIYR